MKHLTLYDDAAGRFIAMWWSLNNLKYIYIYIYEGIKNLNEEIKMSQRSSWEIEQPENRWKKQLNRVLKFEFWIL